MKITYNMNYNLWNFSTNPNDVDVTTLRFVMWVAQNWNKDYYIDIPLPHLYDKCFGYIKENGKKSYLLNYNSFKRFIVKSRMATLDINSHIVHINFNSPLFFINGTKKKDWDKQRSMMVKKNSFDDPGEYQSYPYKNLSDEIWEKIRVTKSLNEMKLFFFIMSEIQRGPFKVIKTDIPNIKEKAMISNNNDAKIKMHFKKYLTKFIDIGFIESFTFYKNSLTITKKVF